MTQNLFKLARKDQQGTEVKQFIFVSNNNRALDFYCLNAGKTQQQGGWMGNFTVKYAVADYDTFNSGL